MGDNVGKIINLCRSRGFTTDVQVRNYLKSRIADEKLVESIIRILINSKIVVCSSPVERPTFPAYKKALAQFFKTRKPMPKNQMKIEMSFKMHWFVPSDAELFISYCFRDGLLEEKDGKVFPTFDPNSVVVPDEWSLHDELNIKTGKEIAKEKMIERERDMNIGFALDEHSVEVSKMMAEDGIQIIEETFSSDSGMSESNRNDFKLLVVRKLLSIGLNPKLCNGLFDYFELNYGLVDLDAFVSNAIQFEGFSDVNLLRKAFDVLSKEDWRRCS